MKYISPVTRRLKGFFILFLCLVSLGITYTLFKSNYKLSQFVGGIFAGNGRYIYVSNIYGTDTNSGLVGFPVKTITRGIALAQPGDTVSIESGVYTEHVVISSKNGTSAAPIRIVGESTDPASYPVIDGGDPGYTSTTNNPAFKLSNSSWITIERLKFQNSTNDTIVLSNSHYIVIRRNKIDYHDHAVFASSNTSHMLMEYNDIYQNFPVGSKWSDLKGSKWEGGAFVSFTGAGMNTIRFNYFHDQFNAIYMHRGTSTNKYLSANTWIYRNRFENIVDDSFEPESFAFNNHFFNNTLINSHRLISLAPNGLGLLAGPIYVYNNVQITKADPTKEALTGRINSTYKVELDADHFENGVYAFNNSIDLNYPGINTYAIDFLNGSPTNFYHYNHAYTTPKNAFSKVPVPINSELDNDLSQGSLGYSEKLSFQNTNPGFTSPSQEDLRPTLTSALRGKSKAVVAPLGFTSNNVVLAGADLGAYQYGESDFRKVPSPIYMLPPGGEPAGFPANLDWPADIYGGSNPPSGPAWSSTGKITFTPATTTTTTVATPTPTPVVTPTPVATITPAITPTPTPTPVVVAPSATPTPVTTTSTSSVVTLKPVADAHVRAKAPTENNGTSTSLTADFNPDKIVYLKFDTSAIKSKVIDSAVLNVTMNGTTANTVSQNVKIVSSQDWTELGITYATRPALGQVVGSFKGGVDKQIVSSPLTMTTISSDTVTLGIDTSSTTGFSIYSRESSYVPTLVIKAH